MKTLKYKCTLLSDVILNVKSASEGANATLDFIPGNNFLGITAKIYPSLKKEDAYDLFHSGKVRFGDAHPAIGNKRTLKVAASMYYPKLSTPEEECYIHHRHDYKKDKEIVQLKQMRNGFYAFDRCQGIKATHEHNFSIKSAYDRHRRRSADEMMFGYESIGKGASYYFSIETDRNDLEPIIDSAILGIKHIGRSRTAQYGLVKIERMDFVEVPSEDSSSETVVYADGRLIFLGEDGMPTYQPTVRQLGLDSGEIDWEKSQIRTFNYSPWNFKRECFDTDRCGIEKGSVFVIKDCKLTRPQSRYIGSYVNEGFGKVIYNPSFLASNPGENGRAKISLISQPSVETASSESAEGNTSLLQYLRKSKHKEEIAVEAYKKVNDFKNANKRIFSQESFASQWGSIRSLITRCTTKTQVEDQLFKVDVGYLVHGVAKEKWGEYERIDRLRQFIQGLNDDNVIVVMTNLCGEMAKLCRKGDKR